MTNSGKVIKGLEEISDYFFNAYHHSKNREEMNRCDAVEDALTLLKEQETEIRQLKLALDIVKGTCKGIVMEGR